MGNSCTAGPLAHISAPLLARDRSWPASARPPLRRWLLPQLVPLPAPPCSQVLLDKGVDEGKILFLRWVPGYMYAASGSGTERMLLASLVGPCTTIAAWPRGSRAAWQLGEESCRSDTRRCLTLLWPWCSLIAAPEGIHVLCKKFPRMKVRTRPL